MDSVEIDKAASRLSQWLSENGFAPTEVCTTAVNVSGDNPVIWMTFHSSDKDDPKHESLPDTWEGFRVTIMYSPDRILFA